MNDPGARDELRALGFHTSVTMVGGKAIVGHRPEELAKALNLGVTVGFRDPSETLPMLERLLEAAQRAVRQMPDDKMDYDVPDTGRPMSDLMWNIFRRIPMVMEGLDTGVPPEEGPCPSYRSFKKFATYAGQVLEEYRVWTSRQDLAALRQPAPPGFQFRKGVKTGAELLDATAHHTAHHLRQVYSLLESFGIPPRARLREEELPPEYVMDILW